MKDSLEGTEFGTEQTIVDKEDVFLPVSSIKPVHAIYLELDDLAVDEKWQLWVLKNAPALSDSEALRRHGEGLAMFRMIILPNRRRIADLTAGRFILAGEAGDKLEVETDLDQDKYFKVTSVIKNAGKRDMLESLIRKRINKEIGQNVLRVEAPWIGDDPLIDDYSRDIEGYGFQDRSHLEDY